MKKPALKLYLYLFLFSLLTSGAFCQTENKADSLSGYTFEKLSEKFYAAKPDSSKAVLYAKYYVKKAKEENDTIELGDGFYFMSDITKDSTYFLKYWIEIIEKTKNISNKLYPTFGYMDIGYYYHHKGEKNKSLINYLKAYNSAIESKNDSLKYIIKQKIGNLKTSNNEYEEAISLYKKSFHYFNNQHSYKKNNIEFQSLLLNITNTYLKLDNLDSAYYYNEKAKYYALKFNQLDAIGYIYFNKGKIEYRKNKFSNALQNFNHSIPYIVNDENYIVLSSVYKYIGNSNLKLGDTTASFKYFNLIDSLKISYNFTHLSQKPAYKFLANYYKEKKDNKKQLEYINKYITVDSVLNLRAKNIAKNLNDNYDIPNLLAEKEIIEARLKHKVSRTEKWSIGIGSFAALLGFFLIHQTRKRKNYKKRFKELLEKNLTESKKNLVSSKNETANISTEVVSQILEQLEQFENHNTYLSSAITLADLAKEFNTNSNYLSKVINQYKNQSFSQYINQLRIEYTISLLKTDTRFRKYSIKAIANDVGFNTTESFSNAFYKNTGIKPSYFIKELSKE